MTLTSFSFFEFLLVTVLLFYLIRPIQKYILLVASIYFYIGVSSVSNSKLLALMLGIWSVTYFGAIVIDKTSGKIRSLCLIICVMSLLTSLFTLKYAYNIVNVITGLLKIEHDFAWLQFAAIIGISYYALSAVGYLIDVYWQNYSATRNPVDIALFIFYFPQLISGPFTRFSSMKEQFNKKMNLDYNNITYGMRRMAWGYFKKLVISERFGVVVTHIYGDYNSYSMVGIVGATLCYAVQLYTDFSGCMDIIMGASKLFGIDLPENFSAPFFSETIQEFWQRWHITLGLWFKDYVMYPVQKSKTIQKIGKYGKRKFGKRIGKKIAFYTAMLLLWILIGIWHGGTGYYFIASAGIPCILLILSDIMQPVFKGIVSTLKINTECTSWHVFRRIRTLLLICICWIVACSGGTHTAVSIIKHMLINPINYTAFTVAIDAFGLNTLDILIMAVGIVVIYVAHRLEYMGTSIIKKMDEQNLIFRISLIYVEVMMIFIHGMVGSSSFIYFQF